MSDRQSKDELFGHPKGLYVLFFTEMWERFSYYGMRAILVLFLIAQTRDAATAESPVANPGFGWDEARALALYGWYTMSVYVASIPGGLLADRLLGQKKAVMFGGILLVLGHGTMAVPTETAFYTALVLIVSGVGLLKPNISTLVGGLYRAGDPRRDKGFTIFYIGINIGAAASSFIVGYVGEVHGWHYGFGLAGIGMLFGQIVYIGGQKYLKGVGERVTSSADPAHAAASSATMSKEEKDRVIVLLLSFVIVIVFWGAFEQAGGLMNIYTSQKVDRFVFGWEVPASIFQALNPLYIIIFGTVVATYWYRRKVKRKEASSLFQMALGTIIMGLGFLFMVGASLQAESTGQAALHWLFLAYLFHTIGELCLSPVALSFITKLAPAKYASLMMGVYFAMTGFGNKLAGMVGEQAEGVGELAVFGGITAVCVAFGVVLILFLRPLKRLTHGAEDEELRNIGTGGEVDLQADLGAEGEEARVTS